LRYKRGGRLWTFLGWWGGGGGGGIFGGCLKNPVQTEQERNLPLVPDSPYSVIEVQKTSKSHQIDYESNYEFYNTITEFYYNSNYIHDGSYMNPNTIRPIFTQADIDFNNGFKDVYLDAWRNETYTRNFPFSDEKIKTILANNNFVFTDYRNPYYGAEYVSATGNIFIYNQNNESSHSLFGHRLLHESGHMLGLGESLAYFFSNQNMQNKYSFQDFNLPNDPIFDELLCSRVGKQRFWAAAFTSNAEYKKLFAENVPEIKNIDDFIMARSIEPYSFSDEPVTGLINAPSVQQYQIQQCSALKQFFMEMTNTENTPADREYYKTVLNDLIESQARFARNNGVEPIELVFDDIIQRNASLGTTSVKQSPREVPNSGDMSLRR
jgi:hypothetical protein